MKRAGEWHQVHSISDTSSDSDSDSDSKDNQVTDPSKRVDGKPTNPNTKFSLPEGVVTRRAEMYQEYMKQIPVPTLRGSIILFKTWQGLGNSMKMLYGQPLHYLTNVQMRRWDMSRIGSKDEHKPLDAIIHPIKAEAIIWIMEEVHRLTASHSYIAKLWIADPMYHAFVDPIFPQP